MELNLSVKLGHYQTAQLFSALWGLWYSELDKRKAPNLAEQLLTLAGRAQDPGLLLEARHALGPSYLWGGEWATALAHLEQGIALYDPQQHRSYASLYAGHDPGVCCLCHAAWCLGMLGTKRRSFGNIVGHVQGVGDVSRLSGCCSLRWRSSRCSR